MGEAKETPGTRGLSSFFGWLTGRSKERRGTGSRRDRIRSKGWHVVGKSVLGAAHFRSGLGKQDAILWLPEAGEGPPLVLAVSDGHGSPKSFRSHRGAELAVKTAVNTMYKFVPCRPRDLNLSMVKRTAEERLPQELVRRWTDAVKEDLQKSPFTAQELDNLKEGEGIENRRSGQDNPAVAYGATLLAVLLTKSFILYLQLGDGDILTVSEQAEVSRVFPKDVRLVGGETTSLCSDEAWNEFQARFQTLAGSAPALVLLSTDGYANSFRDEAAFFKVGSDLLHMIRSEGLDTVRESLGDWLAQASEGGSGDDITLGILCRMSALGDSAR
jgi:serine/threonine protein phosphatase PrpC